MTVGTNVATGITTVGTDAVIGMTIGVTDAAMFTKITGVAMPAVIANSVADRPSAVANLMEAVSSVVVVSMVEGAGKQVAI
jgi:hypothetical protein